MSLLLENPDAQADSPSPDTLHSQDVSPATAPNESIRVRLGRGELANLTSQLAIMTKSGIALDSALISVRDQAKKPAVRDMLSDIHEAVLGGQSFSQALASYERTFGAAYVASVRAGESAGNLSPILAQLAQMLRGQLRLRATIRSMMIYPIVLTSVSFLVVGSLVVFVLPQFAGIFDQFEIPLPMLTQIFLGIGNELFYRIWIWGPMAIGVVVAFVMYQSSSSGKQHRDHFLLTNVAIRHVSQSLIFARACRMMGLMLSAGVPLLESYQLTRNSIENSLFSKLFADLEDDVINGREISETILGSPYVPGPAARMFVTAEETGNLGEVTVLLADHYEEDGEIALRDFVSYLEPIITVVMGLVVALVVLAVLLPMLDIATLSQN